MNCNLPSAAAAKLCGGLDSPLPHALKLSTNATSTRQPFLVFGLPAEAASWLAGCNGVMGLSLHTRCKSLNLELVTLPHPSTDLRFYCSVLPRTLIWVAFTDGEQKFREAHFIHFLNGRAEAFKIHFLPFGMKSKLRSVHSQGSV